jgi:GTP-binding protein Era
VERLFGICEKYLPEQAWWYGEDELTDRSEKFLASETMREKLFRFTGDELPYTSTVVIDKFEEEPSPKARSHGAHCRHHRGGARQPQGHGHRRSGRALKRIGTEARTELEKLLGAKVFLELWVKVRSGWADDEARVKSFGYE